jgi:hypothetical protein
MNLLEQIISIVPEAQKEAIRDIIKALRGSSNLATDREIQFEAKRLLNSIAKQNKAFAPNLFQKDDVIDSAIHNQNMEGIYIDLKALYRQIANTGNIQSKQVAALQSDFNKARAAIFKLINDARVFALRNRKPEFDDIKLVNFNISRNFSTLSPVANLDVESRLLKLPEILKVRNHLARRNLKTTSVSIDIQASGSQGGLGKQFLPENAIDGKVDTFWAELIYSDTPVQQNYTRIGSNGSQQTELISGPIVKYNVSFSSAEPINQIKILPFAPYPVKVLDIKYKPSSASRIPITVGPFDIEESLDWMEFNFETIYASDIEIIFAQENYKEFILNIPKTVLYATDFLLRFIEERKRSLSEIPTLEDIDIGGNHEIYQEAIEDLASLLLKKDITKSPSTEVDLTGKTILSLAEVLSGFTSALESLLEEVTNYTEQLPEDSTDSIETLKKIEYVTGCREIQTNYVIYSPVGNYESEKFEPKSTVSNVELEVEERHPIFRDQYGDVRKTSTEWEIELAPDRTIPIFPSNNAVEGFLPVDSEVLNIDFTTRVGLSRFPSQFNYAVVKENESRLTNGVHYDVTWTASFSGRLQVKIKEDIFDKNKVYTVSYFATQASKEVDIFAQFGPKRIPRPEAYQGTDSDNKIATEYYPFVSYSIINSDDFSVVEGLNSYRYTSPTGAYEDGLIKINPLWVTKDGSYAPVSGSRYLSLLDILDAGTPAPLTGYGSGDFSNLNTLYTSDPYKYYLRIERIPNAIYEIDQIVDAETVSLVNVPEIHTGVIFNEIDAMFFSGNVYNYTGEPFAGGVLTGGLTVPYSIHVVHKDGDEIFGFDNLDYDPIDVVVGGIRARNITNYTDLEQPAFSISNQNDNEYEYIHDGRFLYFNQSISSAEIQIDYKWMTKYIKVNCKLRSHKVVNPTVTPQINEFKLLLNTTIL